MSTIIGKKKKSPQEAYYGHPVGNSALSTSQHVTFLSRLYSILPQPVSTYCGRKFFSWDSQGS